MAARQPLPSPEISIRKSQPCYANVLKRPDEVFGRGKRVTRTTRGTRRALSSREPDVRREIPACTRHFLSRSLPRLLPPGLSRLLPSSGVSRRLRGQDDPNLVRAARYTSLARRARRGRRPCARFCSRNSTPVSRPTSRRWLVAADRDRPADLRSDPLARSIQPIRRALRGASRRRRSNMARATGGARVRSRRGGGRCGGGLWLKLSGCERARTSPDLTPRSQPGNRRAAWVCGLYALATTRGARRGRASRGRDKALQALRGAVDGRARRRISQA
jgi:hypothetical protein